MLKLEVYKLFKRKIILLVITFIFLIILLQDVKTIILMDKFILYTNPHAVLRIA